MQISIAIAQTRPRKGDYTANLAHMGAIFDQLNTQEQRPDVLVFPETILTGYFLEGGVREIARSAADVATDLQATYRQTCGSDAPLLDVVVGFYERYRDRFYNSSLYTTLGESTPHIRHVHRKVFLPTYGVFDEARFVEAGRQVAAFDTSYGRVAMLICEDAWHGVSGTIAALDGAQIVYVVSASPARGIRSTRPDNVEHWEDLLHRISDEHGVYTVLAQLVGFEGGKGFPGGSFVMGPHGDMRITGPLWEDALLQVTVDLGDLPLARADQPLLGDLELMLPHMQAELGRTQRNEQAHVQWETVQQNQPAKPRTTTVKQQARVSGGALPLVMAPSFDTEADLMHMDATLVQDWLLSFLRDEVQRRRGFRDVVLALSGGVDSALTAFLCAEAFGPEHVLAVRMPYRTSSRDSLDHAQLVIDKLGIRSTTVDISSAVDGYAQLDPEMDGRRKGNVMARIRMIVLFDHSQKLGSIPIGTGNKTERLFGYYTWHADDSPPVNPIGDLYKTQVWQLSRHMGVPEVIVDKPASADLIVGQTDEDDFGITYPRADRILHFLLQGYSVERLIQLGFDESEVTLVKRRVDSTHWKRHLPSTAMLSPTAINEYYLRPVDY
ncbi:MAG: NH3-dependent NAD+ synthetase [Chloroflexi bacterium AL-W]|nr:NH3-dependent NAD+ synthetase [Chloroflexi bacterium AL-N1]NOK66831.1 NH3-dependent NAD+ synthetase [Chloroflexi bacterium AL-N10]NOK74877.1 NH3-dependent NAD+ synthetase [Chloroflexi bacterium AL-N5]NOK81434.1 NH3-dependent NAD+ synthetase [Chloroflexi bacterium AL-W]NOK88903.1 NH3-dependent NAD+ synthetase [Chloroflexi bacterium AL-N15]